MSDLTTRTPTRCDQCGQVDDHPKLHYGVETYHHDCLPFKVVRDLTTLGYWQPEYGKDGAGRTVPVGVVWVNGPDIPEDELHESTKRVLQIRKLAEGGTRGPALAARIEKMHEEK